MCGSYSWNNYPNNKAKFKSQNEIYIWYYNSLWSDSTSNFRMHNFDFFSVWIIHRQMCPFVFTETLGFVCREQHKVTCQLSCYKGTHCRTEMSTTLLGYYVGDRLTNQEHWCPRANCYSSCHHNRIINLSVLFWVWVSMMMPVISPY